jgi:hypothetical protein
MIGLACAEILSRDKQFPCGLQSIRIQRDCTHSPLGLAPLQMNVASHEVNTPHLKIANLNTRIPVSFSKMVA